MTDYVKTEVAAGIMTLTLARPDKKNALSSAMYSALSDGLERAEKDSAVRVVVFQGDGDSFTAATTSPISPPRRPAGTRARTRHPVSSKISARRPSR